MKNVMKDPRTAADGRRVAACLKACKDIPTERLEADVILRLVAACIHVDSPRIREILEELSPFRPRLVKTRGGSQALKNATPAPKRAAP